MTTPPQEGYITHYLTNITVHTVYETHSFYVAVIMYSTRFVPKIRTTILSLSGTASHAYYT